MSVSSNAAAIGFKITADPKQAQKALTDLEKQIGFMARKPTRFQGDLAALGPLASRGVDGLERLSNGFGRAAYGAAKFGVGLGAVATTAAAIGFVEMGTNFATSAATVGRAADRLGMPVEKLSELQIAAHLAGSSAEQMTASLQGLQATVADAAFGRSPEAWNAFKQAGIDVGNATTGAKSYAKMLPQIANETQKLAKTNVNAAQRWLDQIGVGREMFSVLRNGAAGLNTYLREAQDLHPVTPDDVIKARELEHVMATLSERFRDFARIGGAAVAPGMTKFLDDLAKYLSTHQKDVEDFFGSVEKGIEWLATPKNLAWIHEQLDSAGEGIKSLIGVAESASHNPIIRWLLGLPREAQTARVPPIGRNIPTYDDGGWLERTLNGADEHLRRGKGSDTDPQSLGFKPPAPSSESQKALAQEAMAVLMQKGWSKENAAGIVGNLQQESGFNTMADNGTHVGVAQWDAERQAKIAEHFGKRVQQMSYREQLGAVDWELNSRFPDVGRELRQQNDASSSAIVVDHRFEIPANANTPELRREDMIRASRARDAASGFNPDDPYTQHFMQAAPNAADPGTVRIDVHHHNPPPGTTLKVTGAGGVSVAPPRVVHSMPDGSRDVARDGY